MTDQIIGSESLNAADQKNPYAKKTITFRIYSTGIIEKHIPKAISEEGISNCRYIYIDSKNKEHEITDLELIITESRQSAFRKNDPGKIPAGWKKTYTYPAGGSAQRAYCYENGDIICTGIGWTPRRYKKGLGTVQLVRMKDKLNYVKENVKIGYTFSSTQRRYCNPETYAGLIGALAETGKTDNISTGFCFSDATCFPSREHPNGDCGDFVYSSLLELEQKRVNAFLKFHFTKIIAGKNNWTSKITGNKVGHAADHDNHLHVGEFNLKTVLVIQEKKSGSS